MSSYGPRKTVTSCNRVGQHGGVSWLIELECGHALERNRKAKLGDKLSCSSCTKSTASTNLSDILYESNDFEDVKTVSKIAAHFNVRMDQVQLGRGMATIYIDSSDIQRIIN